MKQNINKKISNTLVPQVLPQVLQHLAPLKNNKKQSSLSNNSSKNINDINIVNKSNSKNKISRLETNQSRNQQGSIISNSKLSPTKRFKTQVKSNREHTNTSQTGLNKQTTSTKRLRTDQTDRVQSPTINLFKIQDDYNATSIAQLIQFHTGYHDMDQQQFNYRVRKQTQGSRMGLQKQKNNVQSQKSNSIDDIQIDISDNKKNKQSQDDDQQQNQQQGQDNSQNSISKQKLSKQSLDLSIKKQSKFIKQKKFSQDDPQLISSSVYEQGQIFGFSQFKKQQPNFKKKQIRSYSHEDKLKIIAQSKYLPKNEQQVRMQARYLKGQMKQMQQIREIQEMKKFMLQYKNNKKLISQQSIKKCQISKMMDNIKIINKISQNSIKKSLSLPKIKPYQEYTLPDPDIKNSKTITPELTYTLNNYKKYQNSLSATRFHYQLKKQTSLQKLDNKQKMHTEVENVEYIQNVLRSKGIQFDVNSIRKGLINVRVKTDIGQNQVNKNGGIDYPIKLLSNPKYQKYPL